MTDFFADLLNPELPGDLDDERASQNTPSSSNELGCSVYQARYEANPNPANLRDDNRNVMITFTLTTRPMQRPSDGVPVPLLGDTAYQQTGKRLGPDGSFSHVAFRVRNLEVKVSTTGGELGHGSPPVADSVEKTSLAIATELENHVDDLMPYPTPK